MSNIPNIPNQKEYKDLTPFDLVLIQKFPFIEEDFDAVNLYGILSKIKDKLNIVISNEQIVTENQQSVFKGFTDLHNYVEDYFTNLDVQDEINNKLDEMVESGTLQEIINQYLQSNCLWVFNNIQEMKNATNLVNNSKAKTVGYYNENDNGGAEYKIRNKTILDIEDNKKIIFLQNNLVAELFEDNSKVDYIFPKNWDGATGDANLIIAFGKVILIDTYNSANKNDLYQMLENYNISHIDYCILTHYHNDHVGNFINLVNDGYIDNETTIYLPGYYYLVNDIPIYNTIHQFLEEHPNLQTIQPHENDVLEIGSSFSITFYNCEASIFDEIFQNQSFKDYNNCSTICFIKHGKVKSLYTGDAYAIALDRLYDKNYVNEKIDLYKIEHHGVNYNSISIPKKLLNAITPTFAVQPSSLYESQKNNLGAGLTTALLKDINCKIFATHKNNDYIVFCSQIYNIKNINGKETFSISNANNSNDIYVNSLTSNVIQNGTQNYPYKELSQAIGECNPKESYTIHLADGNYNISHEQSAKNISRITNFNNLKITGNSNNIENVKIYNGFLIYNSNVEIENCLLYADDNNGFNISSSNVIVSNCKITTQNNEISNNTAFYTENESKLNLNNVIIENVHLGISSHYDTIFIREVTFNNIDGYPVYLRNSLFSERNTKYNNTSRETIAYENSFPVSNKRIKLFDGDVKTGNINLLHSIVNFNKIVVVSGYAGSGTLWTDVIYPYSTKNFEKNVNYKCSSIDDIITLHVDNDNQKLLNISRTNADVGSQQGIRTIWGYYEIID